MRKSRLLFSLLVAIGVHSADAATSTVIPFGSSWKYFIGRTEASSPDTAAWRQIEFNDASWSGPSAAPIGYDTGAVDPIATPVPTSATVPTWTTIYFRQRFVVNNIQNVSQISVSVRIDDGYVLWINGNFIGSFNAPGGDVAFNGVSPVAGETIVDTITLATNVLATGTNVIAIHGLNANTTSSDFVFDSQVTVTIDDQPPTIESRTPPAGAIVQSLNSIEVLFSEPVQGVQASDLLINNVPATDVTFGVPGQVIFNFPAPATGQVSVAFAADHGITDLASTPNPFAGGNWSYTVDPNLLPATFLINEFMASNSRTLNDEDGAQPDWIEIYNPSGSAGSLEGWFLTDSATNLTKWRFPYRVLGANLYLVVFASDKNRTNLTGNLHTSFQLSAGGEYLALVDPNTNVVSAFSPTYPPQLSDVSYGRDRINPNLLGYFITPTPRAANSVGGPGFVPEVQFSHNSRTFPTNQPFLLTLSNALPGAVIYYSFGSNFPGSNSPASFRYTNAIRVSNTLAVRARAFAPELLPGPVTTKSFIGLANQTNVLNFRSDLPIMIIHNYGQGTIPGVTTVEHYVFVQTFESDCERVSMTNQPTLTGRGIIHTRGSSTLTSSAGKASFRMEIQDEFNDDLEVPLLGLPEESDWVLYAPNNFDPVQFHNPLAHALARDTGEYASRTRFFEVYLKDDSGVPGPIIGGDYHGIYVLQESIKRDNNRVDIAELEPEHVNLPEVTGGYMFSIDRAAPGQPQLSAGGGNLNWIEPSYFAMTNIARAPQRVWITGYLNSFNTGLTGPNYTNLASTNFYGNYIDVDSWVNRHIHEVLTFNVDALRLSGYFYKDRGKKIEYGPAWDYDRTQGSTDNRDFNPRVWRSTVPDLGTDFFNFAPWWNRLFTAPDFWQAWIDRYQELRQPGNAYHFDNIVAQINRLANELREAQPREVARWGASTPRSGSRSAGGFTYDFGPTVSYQNEVTWKVVWYSNRLDFMDTNFLPRPGISSSGGLVSSGSTVTLSPGPKAGSSVIFTLDGTDPRRSGGGILPGALSNSGPLTITVTSNVHLFARTWNPTHRNQIGPNNPPISSPWSGPAEASFHTALPPLRITEIMYHPAEPPAGSPYVADDFEYIEFTNIGGQPLNLNRFRLRGGVDFDFGNLTLDPGQSGVLVRHQAAFVSRYGASPLVLGVYINDNLSNAGEELRLFGGLREPILDFAYADNWYPATDGLGFSLVIVDANAPAGTWGLMESWRPSGSLGGTPGVSEAGGTTLPGIVINEISTHTDPPLYDAIELYNPTASAVNLGGWYLTDEFNTPKKFRIPNNTTIPAGGYMVFYATNVADPALAFGSVMTLGSTGGEVFLFSGHPANGQLTGYAQGFDFGAQANGVTFGRHLVSTGNDQFPAQAAPTLGAANSGPKVGPVVISEISYHPQDVQFTYRAVDNCIDEYIELQNISGISVPLYDGNYPTNTWRLRDAVDFRFPPGASIPAGGFILVVPIDPANVQQAAEFRARNGVPAGVTLYGPYQGQLDNSRDSVELVRPDAPNPEEVPSILVERVRYSDDLPWPPAADGFGPVLQRIAPSGYGNDPANWAAAVRTPGAGYGGGVGPSIAQQPTNTTVIGGSTATFRVEVSGPGPITYQWLYNGDVMPGQTSAVLTRPNVQPSQAGLYSCVVFNPSSAIISSNARLTVLIPVSILLHPQNVSLRGSTNESNYGFTTNNATFTVVTTTLLPTRYQWRYNGVEMPGKTNTSLTISNVDLTVEGTYDVVVNDAISSAVSNPARLSVLINPVFIRPPVNQTVVEGSDFTASVEVAGNPVPFAYSWRRGSIVIATNSGNYRSNFITMNTTAAGLILTNNILSSNYQMRLVVYNAANNSPGVLATFTNTVLADFDRDGIPDVTENELGLSPSNPADAALDLDGDGASNRAEYISGTDPANSLSYLRINQGPGAATLSIAAISNRTYTVQFTDNLNSGAWSRLADIVARTNNRVETIVDPAWTTNRFYRVAVPRQP